MREVYREFANANNGLIGVDELRGILNKINLNADERYLEAWVKVGDRHGAGGMDFEEFQTFLVQARYTKYTFK